MIVLRRTLAGLAVSGLLASCSVGVPPQDDADASDQPPGQRSRVVVDTPELRAAKEAAGIEPCAPGGQQAPDAGPAMPEITLPCLGGGPAVDLSELRGPLVVNLFAQWCGPCREELPFYQRLHEEGEGKVDVLGIDYLDTQPGGALDLARETGVTYPLLADPDGLLRPEFRIRGLPGVILVDEEGRPATVEFLVIDSYEQLTDLVEQHLGVEL